MMPCPVSRPEQVFQLRTLWSGHRGREKRPCIGPTAEAFFNQGSVSYCCYHMPQLLRNSYCPPGDKLMHWTPSFLERSHIYSYRKIYIPSIFAFIHTELQSTPLPREGVWSTSRGYHILKQTRGSSFPQWKYRSTPRTVGSPFSTIYCAIQKLSWW